MAKASGPERQISKADIQASNGVVAKCPSKYEAAEYDPQAAKRHEAAIKALRQAQGTQSAATGSSR